MWSLINLILFLAIVILICPQPVAQNLKKILPGLLLAAAAFILIWGIQQSTTRTVTITALDEKNDASDGSEVWLKTVRLDGKEYDPAEYFSKGWISEEGIYKWRNYDVPEGKLQKSITAVFELDSEIELVFDCNKWRGQAQVTHGRIQNGIDCYSPVGMDGVEYVMSIPKAELARALSGRHIYVISVGVLLLLYVYFRFFSRKKDTYSTEKKTDERYIWLDLLKVIACFFIIVIHSTSSVYNVAPNRSLNYVFALLANTITRCAVPIFIMISGVLLIKENTDIKKTLNKAKQAIFVLVVWNITYIVYHYLRVSEPYNLVDAIIQIPLKRGPSGHLWYGYLLVWIYLFAPIVSAMYYGMNKEVKRYFFMVTILMMGVIHIIIETSLLKGIESPVKGYSIHMQIVYIAMMMIGKYIQEYGAHIPHGKWKSLGVALVGFAGTTLLTIYINKQTGNSQSNTLSEVFLGNIMYGGGLFWLFYCFKEQLQLCPTTIKKYIRSVSSVSLGIYYGNELLIWFFDTINIGNIRLSLHDDTNMVTILALCSLYYLISWGIASMMKAVPFLKKLVS